ncbi:EAL domain-containing protein [Pseudoalteromonas sp. SWXJZ94C]|uniref:EAL domain-containing protein n=1 Tax=Pseudoalteromonas sp. SWXJZ94C TaxID=2792065 RepID=UPI0018CF9947|nr:EAL domain-containing protein [Pseudoalteromonas sp. SWXJZ94C]MBH0057672.1 EAL domain-containing protein [Pseudoalteromonas sp. SWXJZ94C]
MLQPKDWHLIQSKGIYFVLITLLTVSLNVFLNDSLHQKTDRSGQQLVKQIFDLKIDTSLSNKVLIALVKSQKFMLKPNPSPTNFEHFVSEEREDFKYKTLSLSLYHPPIWVMESYLFILLNLVILGAASWYYRWWGIIKAANSSIPSKIIVKPSYQSNKSKLLNINQPKNNELSTFYGVASLYHGLYMLIECDCRFAQRIDKEITFKILVIKIFPELKGLSVTLLSNERLAITLCNVPITELDRYIERLHKGIFTVCQNYQENITRKNIKIGACDYRLGADQETVYQLAKSALTLSQSSLLQHSHRLALNHSQEKVISREEVIENIKKNKFILFFQPLFEISTGDILQHEALIRVRHNTHGLLAARYFINQLYSSQDALILDKAVFTQIKKLALAESSPLTISINLYLKNWLNKEFWQWVSSQINDLKLSNKLQFEISESEFFIHQSSLIDIFSIIKKSRSQVVIDNIQSSQNISKLSNCQEVCGLKLSYELVHLVNENTQNQKQIKKIVDASNLLNIPVFAVGVETQKELLMLAKLGVVGAQGFYFSEPLQELTQAAFH